MQPGLGGPTLIDKAIRLSQYLKEYTENPDKFYIAICQGIRWPDENIPPKLFPSMRYLPGPLVFCWVDTVKAVTPQEEGEIAFSSNQLIQSHFLGAPAPPENSELRYTPINSTDPEEISDSGSFSMYIKGEIKQADLSSFTAGYRCYCLTSSVKVKTAVTDLQRGSFTPANNVDFYYPRWASTFKEIKSTDYSVHVFQLLLTF